MNKVFNSKNAGKIMLILLGVQVLYIVFVNLFKADAWVDHDASMLYSHTIHMWEQGKYVLENYREETFLHIDTACLFAMPLYGLTHNIFLAYGISNVLFLLITLYVMYDLLKKLDVKDTYRYAAMLIYLVPYRIGLVQYTNMLFYECSFYNVCILVTLLAIDLFLYPPIQKGDRKSVCIYYVFLGLYAFFTALTAFSRGTYTLLVAIVPIIGCYALEIILSKDGFKHIQKSKIAVVLVSLLSFGAGMLLGKLTGHEPNVTGYSLVLPQEIFDNFVDVFWGHLSIFVDRADPEVLTAEGIQMLILLGFAFFMLIVLIFNLKRIFAEDEGSNALRYLTIVYIWNCFVLGMTDCSNSEWAFPERYLFPGIIPLMLSVPVMLTYMEKVKRDLFRNTLYVAVFGLVFVTAAICDVKMIRAFDANADELKGIKEVLAYAKDNGINTVFFLNDDNAGLISRSLAPDLKVVTVDTREDGTYTIRARENYMCAADRAYYDDENIMAVTWNEQPENVFKDYQISSYQYVGDVEDYHLYHAGSNKFDERAGFPLDDNVMNKSIDFCHTEGYLCIGDINLYGYLETEGNDNYVLLSPVFEAPYRNCRVKLKYETASGSDTVGRFVLLDENSQPVSSADIKSGEEEAVLDVSPAGPCMIAVWLDNGEPMTVKEIDFEME